MGNRLTGLMVGVVFALASSGVATAQPCVLPDNGSGTVTLPPAGCGYLSPDDVHELLVGLPVGTSIQIAAEHEFFFCFTCLGGPNDGQPCVPGGVGCPAPGVCGDGNSTCQFSTENGCARQGGPLGGEMECAESTLTLDMRGTGALYGYNRVISMPVEFETHVGPRTPGQPVQSFPTDMFGLQGQLPIGDPDFDLLRITGGTGFGMPSPGHTTLTRQGGPGSPFLVDSFFDVFYKIEFVGAPGGPFSGMSGSTTGTIRMQTGGPFGACCDTAGVCQVTSQSDCSGSWFGQGTLCTPSPCFGDPPCGDGICESNFTIEDSCSCPTDCGPFTASETGLCTDGSDNDCDGPVDCDDPDCTSDPACGGAQLCPLPPPPTTELQCPATLQASDCVVDNVNDFVCRVEAVSFTAAGGPNIQKCECYPDNPVCGPVHMIPSPGGGFDIRCPGPCPPPEKCNIHFDDGTGPESQGKDFMNSSEVPPGVQVTCDCAPPPDPHRSADGTSVTFGMPDVPPIPAGFFYPGSQPFMGTVNLQPGPLDTMIQRSARMVCPLPPPAPCDPIEVEIVALNLVSINPITVTGTGPDSMWDVAVDLSIQPQPEPPGPMQATKQHPNGGVFNAEIRILPRLTFTEVANPANVKTIDYGLPARPPIRVNFNNVPWVVNLGPDLVGTIAAPSNGNFVPGVQEPPPWPNPNGQEVVTAFGVSKGGGVNHPVDPVPLCPLPGPAPDPCAPFQARDCAQTAPGEVCVPTVIQWVQGTPPQVLECGCRATNECQIDYDAAAVNCINTCPDPAIDCTLTGTDSDGDGVDDRFSCDCNPPPECKPNSTGTDCEPVTCPDSGTGVIDKCEKKCVIVNPNTGTVTLSDCDCSSPNECHMELATAGGAANTAGPGPSGNCVAVDDGTGTVKLPPDGCPYLSPDEFHKLYNGLPPGVTIEIGAIHKNFICNRQSDFCSFPIPPGVDCDDEEPNDPTDGAKECHDSTLELKLRGDMAGNAAGPSTYSRDLDMPVRFETHTGPRTPGLPVQSFDTDMFRLQGQLPGGDPDFDLLRIRAGTDFGMPSPGHTTLTKLPGGPNWAVDSYFDVFYEIEFTGAPGGPFSGMSGSTTGTIRMQTNAYKCVGDCPPDTDCVETRTPLADGNIKVCCECKPRPPQECEPLPDRSGCTDSNCPCFGECINGSYCDDPACCLDPNNCVCYAKHAQESIKLCPASGCFGQCLGGSYCDDPNDPPDCWTGGGGPVCWVPNYHISIYLCGDCFGSCQDGWYCDHPNPDCCLDPGNCQCYPPTHPNSIKMCGGLDKCRPKCVKYNQLTGQVTVEQCDCVGEECYVKFGTPAVTAGPGGPCEVVDNGSGSVDLPPAGCDYLSPQEVHKIIDGLPAGTEIHLAPIHKDFICHKGQQGVCSFLDVDCKEDGGNLGGEKECSDSTLEFQLTGTGSLSGWNRIVTIPNTSFETHIGKKKPFEPVQSFPTEIVRLQGQFSNPGAGDPDFDLLRIRAGTGFGMPSPGHTTLTRLGGPGSNWAVDSYFDISYQIDFVGTGPRLGGMSGSTTGTIRMATPTKFKCSTDCPDGQTCVQTVTQPTPPDGTMTICCDCVDTQVCGPKPDRKSCTNNTCPPGVVCKPTKIRCYPPPRGCEIEDGGCDCLDGDPCHVEMPPAGSTVPVCTGTCQAPSPPNKCVRKKENVTGQPGVFDYSCRCVPVHPKPVPADTSVPGKNRHLSVAYDGTPANTAGPGGPLLAARLRSLDLQNPVPPNLPTQPPPDYSAYEEATCTAAGETASCERWAGLPQTFYEWNDLPLQGTYRASRLECAPVFFDWSLDTNVNMTGAEVVPSSRYAVQFVDISCADTLDEECFSEALELTTARFGDLTPVFNPPGSTQQPDALDVSVVVNKVKQVFGGLPKSVAQMQPNAPEPHADVNALDIAAVVAAVKQAKYPFSGPCPCPSLMTCSTTACASDATCIALPEGNGGGAGAKCVKTCVGGANAGRICITNTQCPGVGAVCGNGGMNPGFCRDRCSRCEP